MKVITDDSLVIDGITYNPIEVVKDGRMTYYLYHIDNIYLLINQEDTGNLISFITTRKVISVASYKKEDQLCPPLYDLNFAVYMTEIEERFKESVQRLDSPFIFLNNPHI